MKSKIHFVDKHWVVYTVPTRIFKGEEMFLFYSAQQDFEEVLELDVRVLKMRSLNWPCCYLHIHTYFPTRMADLASRLN
jgi:hypothetical protein